jgi:hypothetical protein
LGPMAFQSLQCNGRQMLETSIAARDTEKQRPQGHWNEQRTALISALRPNPAPEALDTGLFWKLGGADKASRERRPDPLDGKGE